MKRIYNKFTNHLQQAVQSKQKKKKLIYIKILHKIDSIKMLFVLQWSLSLISIVGHDNKKSPTLSLEKQIIFVKS